MVADALSWKSRGALTNIASREWQMLQMLGQFKLQYNEQAQGMLRSLVVMPSLLSRVIESRGQDAKIVSIMDRVQSGTGDKGWTIHTYGSLRYRGRVVVPQSTDLSEEILREFHCSRFAMHPGGTKMNRDLRRQYYWSGMNTSETSFNDASRVSRLRLSTRSQPGYFSHWRWLSGSGRMLRWTL